MKAGECLEANDYCEEWGNDFPGRNWATYVFFDGASCLQPGIDIEKYTNGVDADIPEEGPVINVGDQVVFEYLVTNTGNVPLENIQVFDDKLGAVCTADVLTVGDSFTCTVIAVAGPGPNENIGTATGIDPAGTVVQDEDPSHYFGVEIPVGACCLPPNGVSALVVPNVCQELTETDCFNAGGYWRGPAFNSDDPNTCIPD